MNLALGAVFLAILLIPPLILVFVFGKGTHARRLPSLTLVEYFLLSSVLALFIHSLSIWAMSFYKLSPDYHFIIQFLTGQISTLSSTMNQVNLERYFFDFAKYTLIVCGASFAVGYLLQLVMISRYLRMRPWLQKWRNNRRPPEILCYFNDWWYFFRANEYSGEYSYLGDTQALIYADALLDTKDATILYSGILVDFVIKEDSLEFIYLNGLSKKMFNKKNPDGTTSIEEGEGISIQPSSGLMCIPYSKIINLYIRFVAPIETYFINQLEERIDTEPGYLDDINVKFEDVTPPNE